MNASAEKNTRNRRARLLRKGLGVLQVFVSLGALGGGIGLVSDPSGANLSFRVEWLAGSPFADYFISGIVLLVVNGLGNLVGSVMSFTGKRFAGETAAVLGLFMVAFIAVEMYWIPYSWLQPLYLVLGLVELGLGLVARRDMRVS